MTNDTADSCKSLLNPPFGKGGKRGARGDLRLPKQLKH